MIIDSHFLDSQVPVRSQQICSRLQAADKEEVHGQSCFAVTTATSLSAIHFG